jgi:calcineurin-like phosphoesterase family protein
MRIVNFEQPFYLISDTHFWHTRLFFEFGLRKEFSSTEEVNKLMFDNWNNTVSDNDFVFFLGDFVVGHPEKYKTAQILHDSLRGRKIFLKGNHDSDINKYTNIKVIDDNLGVIYKGKRILLSHRPVWDLDRSRWDYSIFGHIHNNEENSRLNNSYQKNVSVEVINYKPVLIDQVLEEFKGYTNVI